MGETAWQLLQVQTVYRCNYHHGRTIKRFAIAYGMDMIAMLKCMMQLGFTNIMRQHSET